MKGKNFSCTNTGKRNKADFDLNIIVYQHRDCYIPVTYCNNIRTNDKDILTVIEAIKNNEKKFYIKK